MVAEMFQEYDCKIFFFSSIVFSGEHLQMLGEKRPWNFFY